MVVEEIVAIIIIALLVTAIFGYGFRSRGPWGTFWSFFLVLILGMWLVAIWIDPIGPVYYGIALIDFLFVGLLLALLLAAATPPRRYGSPTAQEPEDTAVVLGAFFWIMLLIFVLAIIIGLAINW